MGKGKMGNKNLIKYSVCLCALIGLLAMQSCKTAKQAAGIVSVRNGIDITFTGDQVADSVFVTIAPVPTDTTLLWREYVEAIRNGRRLALPVNDRTVHIDPDSVASSYSILCDHYSFPTIFARPSEHFELKVKNLSPMDWDLSGSGALSAIPHEKQFSDLKIKLFKISRYKLTEHELDSLSACMRNLLDTIMAECNPETATKVVTMLDDDFAPYAFDRLPPGSEETIYYTGACAMRNEGLHLAALERNMEQAIETTAPVASFSLPDMEGNEFDISTLRGKYVVLDFWVSWCGPCRRGFEPMKKLYEKYGDRLEVVAIACGDHENTWKNLVAELELPWINLLAPSPESRGGTVGGYLITAYPTKIIVSPEGNILEYIIGEDESFYSKLEKMLQK